MRAPDGERGAAGAHGAHADASPAGEGFWRRACERTMIAFSLLCAALIIASPQDRELVPVRLAVCAGPLLVIGLAAALLARSPASRVLWALRYVGPVLFLPFFFRLTGQIAPFFPLGYFDGGIMALDRRIFGDACASLRFQTIGPFASPCFGELMCLSYLAYYIFMPLYGGILIVTRLGRGPSPALAWYIACCAIAYVAHYVVFFLFPVEGPAFHLAGGVAQDPGFFFNRLHHLLVARGDVPGGCFPSSHVSIALLHVFIATRLGWRRIRILAALITLGVCFAIVYTQAHYATDALGGLCSGVFAWYFLAWLERRGARLAPEAASQVR
jgi:membrane-associated phospholipid phosphatase